MTNESNEQWLIYENGKEKYLNNLDYLNHLLSRSHKAIQSLDHTLICFNMYDFEEIKEQNTLFYSLFKLQIDSEINSLKRFVGNDIIKYDDYQRSCQANNIDKMYKNVISKYNRNNQNSGNSNPRR